MFMLDGVYFPFLGGSLLRPFFVVLVALLSLLPFFEMQESLPAAARALVSSVNLTVVMDRRHQWITIGEPDDHRLGLVFLPGGFVPAEAYAPLVRLVSERVGIFCIIPAYPLGLAPFRSAAALQVVEAYPEIDQWVVAGHSMGAAFASMDIVANGFYYMAVGGKPAVDLSDYGLPACSLIGSEEEAVTGGTDLSGFQTSYNYTESKALYPQGTQFHIILGGNHVQFAAYSDDSRSPATITHEEQWELSAAAMTSCIESWYAAM